MNRVCGMPKCLNVATINNNWGSFRKTCVNEAFTSGGPMVFEKGSSEHKALYSRQPHYEGVIDPITFGQDNLSNLEMNGFYKMNVIKYVARCDRKNGLEDLQKAQDYLNLLIKSYEDAQPKPCEPENDKKYDFKKYVQELHDKGDTFIPRELGEHFADSIEEYAEEHFLNVSCYETMGGFGVVVKNPEKSHRMAMYRKVWHTEESE